MSKSIPGHAGVAAVGLDAERALAVGYDVVASGAAETVVVHTAESGGPYRSLVRATGRVDELSDMLAAIGEVGLYRSATRDCRRHRVTWPDGQATPGVGMIFGVRRSADQTPSGFHAHWADVHQPLALRHHLGMWDYRQVSLVEPLTDGSADYDGFAIVQFPTEADMRSRFFDSDEGKRVIREDAARFTDGTASDLVVMGEHVLLDDEPRPGPVWVTAHHQVELPAPADAVWGLVGNFGGILDWWPAGLVDCRLDAGGSRRIIMRDDGSTIVEALDDLRPDDHMLVLSVVEGFPSAIEHYRCRYEIRSTGEDTCRVDWQPTALVEGTAVAVFDAIVESGWSQVTAGLQQAAGGSTA